MSPRSDVGHISHHGVVLLEFGSHRGRTPPVGGDSYTHFQQVLLPLVEVEIRHGLLNLLYYCDDVVIMF